MSHSVTHQVQPPFPEKYETAMDDIEQGIECLLGDSDCTVEDIRISSIRDAGNPNFVVIVTADISGSIDFEEVNKSRRFLATQKFEQQLYGSPLVYLRDLDIEAGELRVFASGLPKGAIKSLQEMRS